MFAGSIKSFYLRYGFLLILTTLIVLNYVTKSVNLFSYDVFGYYLYLPKFVHDWNLNFTDLEWVTKINDTYHNTPTLYQFSWIDNQHWIIRYSSGMALLYLPFFLIGHLIAYLLNYPMDGFSTPYQWMIFIESILVTCIGFILLQKTLRNYFEKSIVQLTLVCIFFGTNMMVHSGMYNLNVMSHNYLFMLYALLLFLSEQYLKTGRQKYWYSAIACSALMTLVRPVEIISLCIPVFWGMDSLNAVRKRLAGFCVNERRQSLLSFFILMAFGSIQFIYWKIETGHWIINSYDNPGEGLDLLSPHLADYLFSFRKGWILYTPLVMVCCIGFWYLYKNQRTIFFPVIFVFLSSLYLTASWSVWWYSSSFSSRAAIPAYSYLCFPLAALLTAIQTTGGIKKWQSLFFSGLIPILIVFNLFQTWQFHKGIIDPERMTKAAYLKNFLALKRAPETEGLLIKLRSETGVESFVPAPYFQHRIIGMEDMEFGNDESLVNTPVFEGKHAQRVSPSGFSKAIWIPFNAVTTHDYAYLRISAHVFIPSGADTITKANLCAEMQYHGKTYFWRSLNFEKLNLPRDQWQYVEFIYLTPEVRSREDIFKTYFWNRSDQSIYIDDIKLETFY